MVRFVQSASIVLGLQLAACATSSYGRHPASDTSALQTAYQNRAGADLVRGAAVGMISGSSVPAKLLFGDVRSETDLLEIGSISKSFTGIEISRLVTAGQIDVLEPISKYVKEFVKFPLVGNLTIAELATHTAGLADAYTTSNGIVSQDYSESDFIKFMQASHPNPPGKRSYSNIGFATLGLILSRVEKKPFHQIIQDEIFAPLGMTHSGFMLSKNEPHGLLPGYDVALHASHYSALSPLASAAGGIYSDLHDMTLFLNANVHPDGSALGSAIQYSHAMGFGWDSNPGVIPVSKDGAMPDGFSSYIQFDPTPGKESGVIVLTNEENSPAAISLGQVAMGASDADWLAQEGTPLNPALMKSLIGTYAPADGSSTFKISALNRHFLYAVEQEGNQSGPVRLLQASSTVFIINDGSSDGDAIELTGNTAAPQTSLKYLEYNGVDATGKPVFVTSILQRN